MKRSRLHLWIAGTGRRRNLIRPVREMTESRSGAAPARRSNCVGLSPPPLASTAPPPARSPPPPRKGARPRTCEAGARARCK
eukprot:1188515-Prorocentrum_minimum.AAC.3